MCGNRIETAHDPFHPSRRDLVPAPTRCLRTASQAMATGGKPHHDAQSMPKCIT